MRYFKIYRNCCVIRKDAEMTFEDFDQDIWNEAWEDTYNQSDMNDGESEDEFLDRVERESNVLYDEYMKNAKSDDGYCAGDYYLYARPDDVALMDMQEKRPN